MTVRMMWQLMSDEKTDFMNLTLYSLTLITALATPLMFLTGLFGMNFADMEELVSFCVCQLL
jgi:Mg2+ and Co2+ transporter CorA